MLRGSRNKRGQRTHLVCGAVLGVLVAGGVLADARPAFADDTSAAAAESAFQEGRKMMDQKRYSEACPKFAASQKIAPAIGTLLNLADCYEKNNQIASAWAKFHEAIALAQKLGRTNREQTARERADKLEPKLIKLSILAHATGIEVKLDGTTIDPAVLGTPVPVDAGKHTVEASAKGKKPFTKDIDVSDKMKSPSVDIPPLEDEAKEPVAAQPKDPKDENNGSKDKITEPPAEKKGPWSTQKTIGAVVAGAGIVTLGVGLFFGFRTRTLWNDAQSGGHCTGAACDQTGLDDGTSAKSAGNIATVLTIAGLALGAGGAVLFFTAKKPAATAVGPRLVPSNVGVGVGPGSVVLGGAF